MLVIVCYDVNTEGRAGRRRLRRVAKVCESVGQRVQKSVFECTVGETEWVQLQARLLAEMDRSLDSLRIYYLDAGVRIEHHGVNEPIDLEGPLVI